MDKFFNKDVMEDGETFTFGNPAGLAVLEKGDALLVVDYCFSMPENIEGQTGCERLLNMPISLDTITLHLFAMIK